MSETVKIDKSMFKSVAVGIVSAALVVSCYGLFDANRQKAELRKEITDLKTRLDTYQRSFAMIQTPPISQSAEVKPAPAAPAPTQPAPQAAQPEHAKPGVIEPVAAQPTVTAGRITFDMLAPGLEARPPLPMEAPVGGITKTPKIAKVESRREVARSNAPAITDKQDKDTTWDNQFVLRNKEADAGESGSGQLTIAGQ